MLSNDKELPLSVAFCHHTQTFILTMACNTKILLGRVIRDKPHQYLLNVNITRYNYGPNSILSQQIMK